ncbi:hypothetical protein E2C01_035209 [Portunus trituberculatus]|uniref:Uncharacterized protein n=1 Tax=Portunus trituberculatus TaxID=210409 RepID=A0A5B7F946_PORTR|nr:hypothetical protein [Portunus trituberculatus]
MCPTDNTQQLERTLHSKNNQHDTPVEFDVQQAQHLPCPVFDMTLSSALKVYTYWFNSTTSRDVVNLPLKLVVILLNVSLCASQL